MTRRSEREDLKVSHHGNMRGKGPETGTRRLTKAARGLLRRERMRDKVGDVGRCSEKPGLSPKCCGKSLKDLTGRVA